MARLLRPLPDPATDITHCPLEARGDPGTSLAPPPHLHELLVFAGGPRANDNAALLPGPSFSQLTPEG